jgi:hypothetical protein
MCPPARLDSELPNRTRFRLGVIRKHRAIVAPVAAVALTAAGLAGILLYLHSPADIARAEADLRRAQAVVLALDEESNDCEKTARHLKTRAAECQQLAEEHRNSRDTSWLEVQRAIAESFSQLRQAHLDRRATLLHLAAEYLRLLAEAECEILRAKDARDRGTPYKVAPRVRDLLAPMLPAR